MESTRTHAPSEEPGREEGREGRTGYADVLFRVGRTPLKATLFLSLPFVLMFASLLVVLGVLEVRVHRESILLQLRETASAYFQQILITRLWNAEHSGVYVEVTDATQPNPYLDDPQRDILTLAGRRFTKVHPSSMTRQLSELAEQGGVYKFHITSLRPVNPANAPDDWERSKLATFTQGKLEAHEVTRYADGEEYFRYMAPLFVKEECLACHARQGYKFGDIRGGISVSIPMEATREIHRSQLMQSLIGLLVVGFFSLAFVVALVWMFSRHLQRSLSRQMETERLRIAVELAGVAAHELRQPMSIISGFSELLKEKHEKGADVEKETRVILDQCSRMNEVIGKILKVTSYRTKHDGDEGRILDTETASATDEQHDRPDASPPA